jgi:hypothetical protein
MPISVLARRPENCQIVDLVIERYLLFEIVLDCGNGITVPGVFREPQKQVSFFDSKRSPNDHFLTARTG